MLDNIGSSVRVVQEQGMKLRRWVVSNMSQTCLKGVSTVSPCDSALGLGRCRTHKKKGKPIFFVSRPCTDAGPRPGSRRLFSLGGRLRTGTCF